MSEEERFTPLPGLPGRIFIPRAHGLKKHPCPECFECQWCSDARCAACRRDCEGCPARDGSPEPKRIVP